jgi:hypothetical protein
MAEEVRGDLYEIKLSDIYRLHYILKVLYNLDGGRHKTKDGHTILGYIKIDPFSGLEYAPVDSPTCFVLEELLKGDELKNSAHGITYWINTTDTTSKTTSIHQFIYHELMPILSDKIKETRGITVSDGTLVKLMYEYRGNDNCIFVFWKLLKNYLNLASIEYENKERQTFSEITKI